MEQSPSGKSNSHSASQEIPCLSSNPKVHYSAHNSPPLIPILSQMHPISNFPLYSSDTYSNIFLRYTSGLFRVGFSTKIWYAFLSNPVRATYLAHLIFFDLHTSFEAPHYGVFSSPLSLPPTYVQIFSPVSCSQTAWFYIIRLIFMTYLNVCELWLFFGNRLWIF